jgi:rSAM/selenodomain-associated transferase 2
MPERISLSVVIPTLNAADSLPATLTAVLRARRRLDLDLVVSDGGSGDASVALAAAAGARVVVGQAGRGGQLRRGAEVAVGEWLLFLHADTVPAQGWAEAVAAFSAHAPDSAAYGDFCLDADGAGARYLKTIVGWRCRLLSLPYGDQGLLVPRSLYEQIGGYRDMPLMEDVDLVRRIGRRRLQRLGVEMVTSARRYRRDGYLRRSLRNFGCLSLYFLGVSPQVLARLYR